MDAADRWPAVRDVALALPWATEDLPWGDVHVVKVEKRDGTREWSRGGRERPHRQLTREAPRRDPDRRGRGR